MKVLFLHVPKTAGTSIKNALKSSKNIITENTEFVQNSAFFHAHHLNVMNFRMSNSLRFRLILGKENWDNLWKVAFVRNPWDRYVSNWKWLTRKEELYPEKGWSARGWEGLDGDVSFADFVRQVEACYHDNKTLHGYDHDKWHLRNQIEHLSDPDGKIMVDYIARYENLEEEFGLMCKKAGEEFNLPYLNHTGHYSGESKTHEPLKKHYSKYYSEELKQIVSNRCAADIEAFNYIFEWKNE